MVLAPLSKAFSNRHISPQVASVQRQGRFLFTLNPRFLTVSSLPSRGLRKVTTIGWKLKEYLGKRNALVSTQPNTSFSQGRMYHELPTAVICILSRQLRSQKSRIHPALTSQETSGIYRPLGIAGPLASIHFTAVSFSEQFFA